MYPAAENKMPRLILMLLLCCLPLAARANSSLHPPTPFTPVQYGNDDLAKILPAHRLRCGVITNAEDYSDASTHGDLSAFGLDLCRAVAAGLLGSPNQLTARGYPDDAHGLRALHEGQIDLLFGVTPDPQSALPYDVMFGPTAFFDSQGFLVARNSGITSPAQLDHKLLCFITGTTAEQRMNQWRETSGVAFWAHDFQERGEMESAMETGNCAAMTDDVSELANERAAFSKPSRNFVILPQRIAIDPWAPAMRAGQTRLAAVVSDIITALTQAEHLGITTKTLASPPPAAARLLGPTPGIAATLGMANGWAARAIQAGGNYDELFTKDLGAHSPLLLDRGPDALWTSNGLLNAPTLR
jgi:general L-amino acid transport system substrate-binding protein